MLTNPKKVELGTAYSPPPHARGHGRILREHAVSAAGWKHGNGKSSQRDHLTRSMYIGGCRTLEKRMEGVHSRVLGASGKTTSVDPCKPVGGVKTTNENIFY